MKLSKDLEGHVVTIELGRPIYIMDYAGHVTFADGSKGLLGDPIMNGSGKDAVPVAMNLLIGVRVVEVADDRIVVSMVTPGGHRSQIQVPTTGFVLAITEIVAFEPDDLPTVVRQQRAPEPTKSKLII